MEKRVYSNNVRIVDADDRLFLESVGLSDHEIIVYSIFLNSKRELSAQDVAKDMFVFPSALYRIFRSLENLGLISLTANKPLRYKAVEKHLGFKSAYKINEENILELLKNATGDSEYSKTNIIIGRQATYDAYIDIASKAKKEICIYAIGIAYSDKLHKVQEEALNRGVKIRHLVQQYRVTNLYVIHKWKKLGIDLRHLKKTRGFHFTLIDRSVSLITFSSPDDTENRFSILTNSKSVADLFGTTFEALWSDSKKIKF